MNPTLLPSSFGNQTQYSWFTKSLLIFSKSYDSDPAGTILPSTVVILHPTVVILTKVRISMAGVLGYPAVPVSCKIAVWKK